MPNRNNALYIYDIKDPTSPILIKSYQMKKFYLIVAILFVFLHSLCHAEILLDNNTSFIFATVSEGKQVLTTRDDFVQRMSPFDRAVRMKTDREVSEKEFIDFVGRNVLAWAENEKQKVKSAFQGIRARLAMVSMLFPKTIYLINTLGNEEGGAAYTRVNALVFPKSMLATDTRTIQKLICHEIFHIMSRANPSLRERLYETIGFTKCNEIKFPIGLQSRKITNPDAPKNDHCIRVRVAGKSVWAVPILFSITENYDVARGGEFFEYLQFQFLLVKRDAESFFVKPLYDGSQPRLAGMKEISGFIEQVGMNTRYIIHPEEILADNFSLLVLEESNVPSPEILRKLEEVLATAQIAKQNTPADVK